jgi:hypothetical protein
MNKINYRPASKTESSLDFKKVRLIDNEFRFTINDSSINSYVNGSAKSKSVDIGTQTDVDHIEYSINKLIMFMQHLFLITMFELIFFFNYVTKFEDNALINVFNSLTESITSKCSSLSNDSKIIIDDIFKIFVNTTQVNENAIISYNSRMVVNNNLMTKAITYFIGVLVVNIMLICGNRCTINKKINYKEIIIDNLIMIILLGIYEYIFFSNIVFKYLSISNDEIFQNFQNKFIGSC